MSTTATVKSSEILESADRTKEDVVAMLRTAAEKAREAGE